jgi:TonB family protein
MRAKPFPERARKAGPRMLEQLERQETQEHLVIPRLEIAALPAPMVVENDQRQRRRMVIALVVLLIALGLVLIKDRDFWFPATDVADSEAVEDSTAEPANEPAATSTGTPVASLPTAPRSKKKGHATPVAVAKPAPPAVSSAPAVTASRAVLPPLRVVVVAGNQPQAVRPGNPSVKVELRGGTPPMPVSEPSRVAADMATAANPAVSPAGDRVSMSTDTQHAVSRPVRPEYPLLARQMKVQGAVVLLVLIDKDGSIQNLQIESGPAILADAAREAVKQWRFKPYLQDGQPIETQARVTVDFTILAN